MTAREIYKGVRKVAYGYSLVVDGRQVRKYDSAWSREEAQEALARRLLGLEREKKERPRPGMTLGEAVERYLRAKARKKSLAHDSL